jgi:hypothetical protein
VLRCAGALVPGAGLPEVPGMVADGWSRTASDSQIVWPMRKAGAAVTPAERRSRRAVARRLTGAAGSSGGMSGQLTSIRTGQSQSLTVSVPSIVQRAPLAWTSLAW